MQQDNVLKFVLETLDDYKAVDVVNIDVRTLTTICDNMIICSGTSYSSRQNYRRTTD